MEDLTEDVLSGFILLSIGGEQSPRLAKKRSAEVEAIATSDFRAQRVKRRTSSSVRHLALPQIAGRLRTGHRRHHRRLAT